MAYLIPSSQTPDVLATTITLFIFQVLCIIIGISLASPGPSFIKWRLIIPEKFNMANYIQNCCKKCFIYVMMNYSSMLIVYLDPSSLLNSNWFQIIITLLLYCFNGLLSSIEDLREARIRVKPEKNFFLYPQLWFVIWYIVICVSVLAGYILGIMICSIIEIATEWDDLAKYDRGIYIYLIVSLSLILILDMAGIIRNRLAKIKVQNMEKEAASKIEINSAKSDILPT
jgi:hypothetical protein